MKRFRSISSLSSLLVLSLAAVLSASPAHAGSPLICHQFQIGEAKSLPWGSDTYGVKAGYSASNLVNDTLELLTPRTPVLVRMETLRRATLYLGKDASQADELLGRIMARALNAEAEGKPDALSWFDAGYLARTFAESGMPTSFGPGVTKGTGASALAGYSWVARAIELSGGKDANMHVAAALMIVDARAPEFDAHMTKALAANVDKDAASRDALEWIAQINGSSLEQLRDKFAPQRSARGG